MKSEFPKFCKITKQKLYLNKAYFPPITNPTSSDADDRKNITGG